MSAPHKKPRSKIAIEKTSAQGHLPKSPFASAFLRAAGRFMLVETPLAQADMCLLFGNRKADVLAEHAARLYHKGYFKRIVVSGGVPVEDGTLEAHKMRDVLLSRGVKASDILVEDKATNTGENVQYTMALLKARAELDEVKSIIGIGRVHAARRFLMTLQRHWPEPVKMFSTPNDFNTPKKKYYLSRAFRRAVLGEYRKIYPYLEKGFIADIDLKDMKKRIAQLPQPSPARKMRRRS